MRNWVNKILLVFLLGVIVLPAQTEEYDYKAAFIRKFIFFTEWPKSSNVYSSSKSFVIGVACSKSIVNRWKKIFNDELIKNKSVKLIRIKNSNDVKSCNVLFVCKGCKINYSEIIKQAKRNSVLTIGEEPKFIRAGGIINFYQENDKLRFEINESQIKWSNLTISYHLLKYARILAIEE